MSDIQDVLPQDRIPQDRITRPAWVLDALEVAETRRRLAARAAQARPVVVQPVAKPTAPSTSRLANAWVTMLGAILLLFPVVYTIAYILFATDRMVFIGIPAGLLLLCALWAAAVA